MNVFSPPNMAESDPLLDLKQCLFLTRRMLVRPGAGERRGCGGADEKGSLACVASGI